MHFDILTVEPFATDSCFRGIVAVFSIRTILHPTDLSEPSAGAFRLACALARQYEARLILLTVFPPPITGAEEVDRTRPDSVADDLLSKLRGLNPDPAIQTEYQVAEGDPAEMIVEAAKRNQADLIVMGTHGRSGLHRALMGSVAEGVSRKATCPVLTMRGALPAIPDITPVGRANPNLPPEVDLGVSDPTREVMIPLGAVTIRGTLSWMGKPRGVVIFAHGSGSSRHSPRNQFVAQILTNAGFATLLLDLLTEEEAENRENVFDTALLADRLAGAADWVSRQPETMGAPVGFFGASTGSAAALTAAARHPDRIAAVVSRGGRPDLAWDDLPAVRAATLLIVGGDDEPVLTWNRDSLAQLQCAKDIAVVPQATHLFEEPGALASVAELALDWFILHLAGGKKPSVSGTASSNR
jgi:nucleotide-binding universal stress UspA family protein/dienelactone hydrolase